MNRKFLTIILISLTIIIASSLIFWPAKTTTTAATTSKQTPSKTATQNQIKTWKANLVANPVLEALDADFLTIINLRQIPTFDGVFTIFTDCPSGHYDARFVVLPAGIPPYTWKPNQPFIKVKPLGKKGFVAEITATEIGKTGIVTVTDLTGLKGEIKIKTDKCWYAPQGPGSPEF